MNIHDTPATWGTIPKSLVHHKDDGGHSSETPLAPTKSILAEAEEVINGPRRESYGPVEESFQRIATVWSQILRVEVKPRQVALCMIGLKVLRDANTPQRDALVDICGYAALADNFPPPATVASNSNKEGSYK